MTKSSLGFLVSWMMTFPYPWISSTVALYFAFVDPTAKLGHYSKRKFKTGKEKGKSPFGLLCSYLFALGCVELQVVIHYTYKPVFPADVSLTHGIVVLLAGAAVAPYFEIKGGKWDNFWIPVMASLAMVSTHGLLRLFGL